jgi:hypothetical protein
LFESMMRYYMHDGPSAFRFELAGDLDANDATRLEQDWRTASAAADTRTLIIDLSFVTGIDEAVRSLFRRWHAGGAEFAAASKRSRELVELITERPFARELPYAPTFQPRLRLRSSFLRSISRTIPVIPLLARLTLFTPSQARAADIPKRPSVSITNAESRQ